MTMSAEKSTQLIHGIIEFGLMIDNSETVSEAAEKIVTAIVNVIPSVLAPDLPEPNDQEQWITDGYVIEPVQDGSGNVLITSTGDNDPRGTMILGPDTISALTAASYSSKEYSSDHD